VLELVPRCQMKDPHLEHAFSESSFEGGVACPYFVIFVSAQMLPTGLGVQQGDAQRCCKPALVHQGYNCVIPPEDSITRENRVEECHPPDYPK